MDKQKALDEYDPLSSRKKKAEDLMAASSSKPKFNIDVKGLAGTGLGGNSMANLNSMANIPGTTKADHSGGISGMGGLGPITPVGGLGGFGITPSNAAGRSLAGIGGNNADTQSNASVSRMSNRYRAARAGAQIITPLGSDMSRAKFDFSGYDPNAHRKKKPKSPERRVIKKVEEDIEVFMSENVQNPDDVDLDQKNDSSS